MPKVTFNFLKLDDPVDEGQILLSLWSPLAGLTVNIFFVFFLSSYLLAEEFKTKAVLLLAAIVIVFFERPTKIIFTKNGQLIRRYSFFWILNIYLYLQLDGYEKIETKSNFLCPGRVYLKGPKKTKSTLPLFEYTRQGPMRSYTDLINRLDINIPPVDYTKGRDEDMWIYLNEIKMVITRILDRLKTNQSVI